MKIPFFILLRFALFPLFGFVQSEIKKTAESLPTDIQTFYTNSNLANALTTSEEKYRMVRYLERGDIKHAPSSKRAFYVVELLKHVVGKEVTNSAAMPNSLGRQNQVSSSDIYDIQNWQVLDDCIYVAIHTSTISTEENIKMINSFEEGKFEKDLKSLSTPKLKAKEIHTWVLVDSKWYKKDVHLVLTK